MTEYTPEQIAWIQRHNEYVYGFWKLMIAKCYDKKHHFYSKFGAHGVTVIDRWRYKDTGFTNFFADVGKRPSTKHTLELLRSTGDFTLENVKWMKTKEGIDSIMTQGHPTAKQTLEYWSDRNQAAIGGNDRSLI